MVLTDECIAALPRVEKGLPRDIFAPIPVCSGPYSLDLVLEYSRFSTLPIDVASKPAASPTTAPGTNRPSATQQPRAQGSLQEQQQRQKGANADVKFSCVPCKKSFGSEATWNSHQMSAKHIAAVKDAEKKSKSGGGGGGGGGAKGQGGGQKGGNNNNAKGRQQKSQETVVEEQDPPEVTEALMSFRKVEKIAKENPSMAATVLWKITKALWSYRQSQETAKVLVLLINILTELQADPPSAPGSLSPTQIGMTLYLSRLSMARLIVYHSRSLAFQYYLDAIQGRWQIDPNDFQGLCEMVHTASAAQHLRRCKEYLSAHSKTEKLMAPPPPVPTQPSTAEAPAKKPADPNLKLLTILKESASMMSQTSSGIHSSASKDSTIDDRFLGETALTLFAWVVALSEASGDSAGTIDALRSMAVIYHKGLWLTYSAAACLIRSAEMVFSTNSLDRQEKEQQGEEGAWDLFQALLLAMETGDFVRMERAIGMLESCDIPTFQDVKV
ncbi:hypothetical protein EC957_003218 [Mortierella hygrophila]|uniref:C2H2-type domain-containing protein n=1 Tax=Mortierella hygrophila TaxID=979708 RepID=A0A9P6K170_9FUNG|nr:hypothetical protein EC957_003218 [Mortierella hygrophila]